MFEMRSMVDQESSWDAQDGRLFKRILDKILWGNIKRAHYSTVVLPHPPPESHIVCDENGHRIVYHLYANGEYVHHYVWTSRIPLGKGNIFRPDNSRRFRVHHVIFPTEPKSSVFRICGDWVDE
jgi:hypothetical protein